MASAKKGKRWIPAVAIFSVGALIAVAGMRYVMRPELPLSHSGPLGVYLTSLHVTAPLGINLGKELLPGTVLRPGPDGTYSVEAWVDAQSYAHPEKLDAKPSQFLTEATFVDDVSLDTGSKLALPGVGAQTLSAALKSTSASHVLTVVEVLESRTLSATQIWSGTPLEPLATQIKRGELVVVAQTVHARRLFYSFAKSSEWSASTRAKVLGGSVALGANGTLSNDGWMHFDELAIGFQKVAVAVPGTEALHDPQDRVALIDDMNRAGVATEEAGNPVFAIVTPDQIPAAKELSRITAGHIEDKRKLEAEVTSRDALIATVQATLAQSASDLVAERQRVTDISAALEDRSTALRSLTESAQASRASLAEREQRVRALSDELARTAGNLETLEKHAKNLEEQLKTRTPETAKALAEAQQLRDELEARRKDIADLQREQARQEAALADARQKSEELAQAAEQARKDATTAQTEVERLKKAVAGFRNQLDSVVGNSADWAKRRDGLLASKSAAAQEMRDAAAVILKLTDRRLDASASADDLLALLPKRGGEASGNTVELVRQLLRFVHAQAVLKVLADVR